MKISLAPIALSDYRKTGTRTFKYDIKTLLWRVAQIGYVGIEMGTPDTFSHQEYKDYLDEIGLTAVSAGGLRYPALESSDFSKNLEECRVLGARNVMVSNPPAVVLGNPEELKKFIGNLNRAGKILWEEGGVHLSYHNHAIDFSKVNGETMFRQIIEGTNPQYVFLEPDTHWIQAGGGHVISWLRSLEGRIYIVHFKDYGIDPYSDHTFLEGTHKIFKEVGEGNLNWSGILAECERQKIEWCSVEQDKVQRPAYEALALSVRNLHAFGV